MGNEGSGHEKPGQRGQQYESLGAPASCLYSRLSLSLLLSLRQEGELTCSLCDADDIEALLGCTGLPLMQQRLQRPPPS